MMKKWNKKELSIFLAILLITFALKYPYLSECIQGNETYYRTLIIYTNNYYINVIWLIPILVTTFLVSNVGYDQLINFEMRYHNRTTYFKEAIKQSFGRSLLFSSLSILIEWLLFTLIMNYPFTFNEVIVNITLKYIIEIYLLSLIIIVVSIIANNYIYSFLVIIAIIFICIEKFRYFYVPVVSLFADYTLNIINIVILFLLYIILKKIYNRLDLGGVKNEVNS